MANCDKVAQLAAVRKIIVHPGLAHVDDIMSCAVAYAFGVPHDAVIERRKPTSEELECKTTLVLDVGFEYNPSHLNFDHHQRSREEEPKCSYKLLAQWLEIEAELQMLFPWYDTWNMIDVIGPFATARQIGSTGDQIAGLVANPISEWVVRHFADDPAFRAKVALGLANEIDKTIRCWSQLCEKAVNLDVNGLTVADFRACQAHEISRCSDIWVRSWHPACVLQFDSRGEGLSFVRCNDDPRLDFSRCADKPYALFSHPGGFVLKTRTREISPEEVIADARCVGHSGGELRAGQGD